MENGWVKYWQNRTSGEGEYYGKGGRNADLMIKVLEISCKDKVLDIGCANGAHLTDIQRKTGAECFGIDISPIAVSLNKNKKIKLLVGDMEKIPFESNSFDKVFSLGVFEHSPRSNNVFRELNRVMKTNGTALISVPNKLSLFHLTKNAKMLAGKWDLGYEKSFSSWNIKKILKDMGFELEKIWIEPHIKPGNIFNRIDNLLNKINPKKFGFFLNVKIKKSLRVPRLESRGLFGTFGCSRN